jgi:hypothetical protein
MTGMIRMPYDMGSMTDNDIKLCTCIAAAQFSNSLPINMDPSLSVDELSELKLSSKEEAALTCKCSIYFSNKANGIPIVIDTGTLMSVSPCREDFFDLKETKGGLAALAGDAGTEGVSMVCFVMSLVLYGPLQHKLTLF